MFFLKKTRKRFADSKIICNFATAFERECVAKTLGEMAEWSIAAVLKTVELRGSGGSNPSLSAESKIDDF